MSNKPKRHKPIVCVNRDTGEAVTNWEIAWHGPIVDESRLRMRVMKRGKAFSEESVGVYEEHDTPQAIQTDHPEFGTWHVEADKRKFTKVYQLTKPTFTKQTYKGYWFEITYCLEMNTGIVCIRSKHGNVDRVTNVKQFARLIEASESTAYEFMEECLNQQYLAHIEIRPHSFWTVNPQYCWNGAAIPQMLWDYFNNGNILAVSEYSENNQHPSNPDSESD